MNTLNLLSRPSGDKYYNDTKNLEKFWNCVSFNEGYITNYCIENSNPPVSRTLRLQFSRTSLNPICDFINSEPHINSHNSSIRFKNKNLIVISDKDWINPHSIVSKEPIDISLNLVYPRLKSSIFEDLNFVYNLKEQEIKNQFEAIDLLYEYVDDLIEKNAFFRINRMIQFLVQKDFGIRMLISFLTITHTKKDFLPNRNQIIDAVKSRGTKENLTPKQVSSILKGF